MLKTVKRGNLTLTYWDDTLIYAYSYDTCVMARCPLSYKAIVNRTKYSSTTSKQMTCHVMPALKDEDYVEVEGLPREITVSTLQNLAMEKQINR